MQMNMLYYEEHPSKFVMHFYSVLIVETFPYTHLTCSGKPIQVRRGSSKVRTGHSDIKEPVNYIHYSFSILFTLIESLL